MHTSHPRWHPEMDRGEFQRARGCWLAVSKQDPPKTSRGCGRGGVGGRPKGARRQRGCGPREWGAVVQGKEGRQKASWRVQDKALPVWSIAHLSYYSAT